MSVPSPELPRPLPPRTWRDHLSDLAESFDLSPRRLVVGVVALACIGILGWRLLVPPAPPAEMRLPFAGSEPGSGQSGADDPADGATPGPSSDEGVTSATAAPQVVVHVAGAVASPGV